jgi:dTDP-4-dehydrorhamnose 3,5-epimerase
MPFQETTFPGLIVFEPQVWGDERGYFYESYNKTRFAAAGITADFIQDNQAYSTYGVLRGLHYQSAPYAQAKLVRVVQGEVLDVVVDLRPTSPTFQQSYTIRLSADNKKQLLVPRGFAHGYVVLSQEAIFCYKVDNRYSKDHEGGIIFNDPALALDWLVPADQLIVSSKDLQLPTLGNHRPIR